MEKGGDIDWDKARVKANAFLKGVSPKINNLANDFSAKNIVDFCGTLADMFGFPEVGFVLSIVDMFIPGAESMD